MSAPRLLVGLASVFAGLTVVLAILGFVYSPVVLAVAVPFGIATYVLWYHVSGRLEERVRQRAERGFYEAAGRRQGREAFGGRTRDGWADPGGRGSSGARRPSGRSGPSTAEAYRVLGLDSGASERAVRSAYREKVKVVHPDTKDGDERRFKRVNEAYEHLTSGKP